MPPAEAQQLISHALQMFSAGRLDEAAQLCRQLVTLEPAHADAWHLLGLVLYRKSALPDAAQALSRAAKLDPGKPEVHCNLAAVLHALRRDDEALASCQAALELKGDYVEALSNLGVCQKALGQYQQAIAAFSKALAIRNDPSILANLANAYSGAGRHEEAVEAARKAIALRPDYANAYTSLASALASLGRQDQAIDHYRRAVALAPGKSEFQQNLAAALLITGEVDQAIAAFNAAIAADPASPIPQSAVLFALHYDPSAEPEAIFTRHVAWGQRHAQPLAAHVPPHANPPEADPNRRLRIGYVSADFRQHSVACFIEPILQQHDRGQFEVFCYADEHSSDAVTERLRKLPDHWRSTARLSDEQLAQSIRGDRIDILVDLMGHTAGNRLLAFARRPAPVQVTYLGYPDTTGVGAIDYRITDNISDPPGMTDQFHTEKLARLPAAPWCYCPPPESQSTHRTPRDPVAPIVFGCFNIPPKISSPARQTWARILHAVPSSRLMLRCRGESGARRLIEQFAALGISADRLEIRPHLQNHREHLDLYNQLDIVLDPFPYNGTTTTCEALYMGVPVIALAGRTHASRVGASLLTGIGLPDLIAGNLDQYVTIATRLAGDKSRLDELHQTLRGRMQTSRLMDAGALTRDLERAYRQMWQTWCAAANAARVNP